MSEISQQFLGIGSVIFAITNLIFLRKYSPMYFMWHFILLLERFKSYAYWIEITYSEWTQLENGFSIYMSYYAKVNLIFVPLFMKWKMHNIIMRSMFRTLHHHEENIICPQNVGLIERSMQRTIGSGDKNTSICLFVTFEYVNTSCARWFNIRNNSYLSFNWH